MIGTLTRFIRKIVTHHPPELKKEAPEAYDLWAGSYDDQPHNLMLTMDEEIFTKLFEAIDTYAKSIADIGCGTGRHWDKLFSKKPGKLTGFDVSQGMLNKLHAKYPGSEVNKINDNLFSGIPDQAFDIIISTLTIAHIDNLEEALSNWCRLLKPSSDILITDFHPEALAFGGSRTFYHGYQKISVNNHIHPLDTLKNKFKSLGFTIVQEENRRIDDTMKHYYQKQKALDVFNKYKGIPMIYGIHFKKGDVIN